MSRFIDEHRGRFGVEPICRTLDVSASAYYRRASGPRSERAVADERLLERIRELHAANYYAYGYRKLWLALRRAGEPVGRDRVKRLMRQAGIQGAKRRGKPWRTTTPDPRATRPSDLVERDFNPTEPNRLGAGRFHLPPNLGGMGGGLKRRRHHPDRAAHPRRVDGGDDAADLGHGVVGQRLHVERPGGLGGRRFHPAVGQSQTLVEVLC